MATLSPLPRPARAFDERNQDEGRAVPSPSDVSPLRRAAEVSAAFYAAFAVNSDGPVVPRRAHARPIS
jgi:hypothetical protein